MKSDIILCVFIGNLIVWSSNAQGPAVGCQGHPDPYLIFVTINNISRVNIDGSDSQALVTGLSNGVAVDYDYYNDRMYWTDVSHGHIRTAPLSTGHPITTLVTGLSVPDGIAIDWVNNKLYWTDTGTNILEQSDLYGNFRRILVNDTDEPRAIALDPMNDVLYMTDWGASPRIEKMHLDGSGRVTIVTQNLVWPNAVTIDFTEPALYWADASTDIIARGDLDGNNVVTLLSAPNIYHPFAVTVFGEYLYWTDWSHNSVERISKRTPNSTRVTITDGHSRPSGIHIVHPNRQPGPAGITNLTNTTYRPDIIIVTWDSDRIRYSGEVLYYQVVISSDEHVNIPNSYVNVTCLTNTFLDLRSNTTYNITVTALNRAGCGVGISITASTSADLRTQLSGPDTRCQANPDDTDPYLIFITRHDVRRSDINGTSYQTMVTGLQNGVAIDFHYYNDRMYWTDVSRGHISTAPLSTGYPVSTLVSGLSVPDGVAVDWINNKLYWTDTGTNTLEQSDLYGNFRRILINATDEPRGIALDPMNDVLYMTDWGASPRIEKMHLDGSGRVTIVTQNLVWPNAVTIDFTEPALYWADAFTDIIARGDLDGNNVVILLRGADTYHPFGVSVFGDYLYWTDWSLNSIERISKHIPNSDRVRITSMFTRPSGIHVVHSSRQLGGGVGGPPTPVNMVSRSRMCLVEFVTISWDPVSSDPVCGPVSYDVTISPSDGVTMMRITDTSYNFTGLTPDNSYTVTVAGRNDAGVGESSETSFYLPNYIVALPRGVTHLINTTYKSDLIIVTWDPASSPYCGEVLYYQVVISSNEHNDIKDHTVNTTGLTSTFLYLRNYTIYTIMVAAVNRAGVGVDVSITVRTAVAEVVSLAGPDSNRQSQVTDNEDDSLSTSVAVAITAVVTFIITLVVTSLISILVTRMCYKHRQESMANKKPNTDAVFENKFVLSNQNDSRCHAENPLYDGSSVTLQSNPSYAGLNQAVNKQ